MAGLVVRASVAIVKTDAPGRVVVRPSGQAVVVVTTVGRQGPPGRDSDGATDPGDLTLIFKNALV